MWLAQAAIGLENHGETETMTLTASLEEGNIYR